MSFYKLQIPEGVSTNDYAPSLSPDIKSQSTFQFMRKWYDTCLNSHRYCTRRQDMKSARDFGLPTRLLDVGPSDSINWRLRITSEDHLEAIEAGYVTLSHRWGLSHFIKLTSPDLGKFRQGLPISELPNTFQDAILVTRSLGIRYIWIDSICISQDDDKIDWVKEAPRMHQVYGHARFNIVAAHSEGPEGTLFRLRDPSLAESIVAESLEDEIQIIWDRDTTYEDFNQAPLMERGWVFQERLLAPRMLHFGKNQVYWRCKGLFAGEGFPFGAQVTDEPDSDSDGMAMDGVVTTALIGIATDTLDSLLYGFVGEDVWADEWTRFVEDYSRCALTFAADKLVALSGIANLVCETRSFEYLAGLWKTENLAQQLCWSRSEDHAAPQSVMDGRSHTYRAPSWSWASINEPIKHYGILQHFEKPIIKVSEATVVSKGASMTADVEAGHIKLRGYLLPYFKHNDKKVDVRWTDDWDRSCFEIRFDREDTTGHSDASNSNSWILPIICRQVKHRGERVYHGQGILLQKMADSTTKPAAGVAQISSCRRRGHVMFRCNGESWKDVLGFGAEFDHGSEEVIGFVDDQGNRAKFEEITII
ncbi:heterokaryon incompatibility protein-domain-containing protein [Cladorrhinum sp. PSN332]|nr:heterokaryon incompatibility protein-domain-containing protein [Cladorrhinum sp. PSN332]